MWLRFGRRMLLLALKNVDDCCVRFPDDTTIEEYMAAITRRHESLKDVYCVADGMKIPFESCDGLTDQSKFYNGWLHGHYITNLFVFGADGRIINAIINVPGSVHDSTLAIWGGTYRKLKEIYQRTGGICCVDSAFASGKAPYLIKSAQDPNVAKSAGELVRLREATSLRQAAEWGMRAIQGSMPRLKDALHYEEKGERKRIMKLVPLLYNLRLARVGLNQIANTYVPHWSKDANYFVEPK
jgi:DDE superfamily endonuclease